MQNAKIYVLYFAKFMCFYFALFVFYFACIWRGDLSEGILRYEFGGLIHGGDVLSSKIFLILN